jgi:hypothetical protein
MNFSVHSDEFTIKCNKMVAGPLWVKICREEKKWELKTGTHHCLSSIPISARGSVYCPT